MRAPVRTWCTAGLITLAPAVALVLLLGNGAIAPPPELGLPDPGIPTRWGLPISRALRDIGAAITIGALVLAATAIPPESKAKPTNLSSAHVRMLNIAALAGTLWVSAGLANLVLTYSDLAGTDPADSGIVALAFFVLDFDLGRALLLSLALAAVAAIGSALTRRPATVGVLTIVALAALWPLATTGHASSDRNHDLAVNAQAFHLLGVTIWTGGLASLALARRQLGDLFPTIARRYSTIAGCCFALVALSGIQSALLRITTWSGLASNYGLILLTKTLALILLGAAGWYQRRRILSAMTPPDSGRTFARLALVEIIIMAIATGAAVALSRTPPPADGQPTLTAAESLLGFPLPRALGIAEWFTQWRVDTFWTSLAVLGIVIYVCGAVRLRIRRDRWPLTRTIAWITGCLILIWATSGAPGVYADVLFSMHMVQHMTIAIAVPSLLVLGAPITLALRTLPVRHDGSHGPREWLLKLVHSRLLKILGHPLVAAALFIVGLVIFYYSSLFELSLRSHTAHLIMIGHFLFSGYLLASTICGIDPGPRRPPHLFRMLLLMVTFAFHAFFSISLMSNTTVLANDWFSTLGRTWGNTPERDQYIGASLGWALGDYPLAILAVALIADWVKTDQRDSNRYDRQAKRDNDQALHQYNEYLQQLANPTSPNHPPDT